ncbi:MAG: hypothetical protein ACJ712_11645 [Nitrososphaeraceae archaeon]
MTFKDLKKRVSLEVSQEQSRLFDRLQGKAFWIWDKQQQHKQEDIKNKWRLLLSYYWFSSGDYLTSRTGQ